MVRTLRAVIGKSQSHTKEMPFELDFWKKVSAPQANVEARKAEEERLFQSEQ